MIDVILNLRSQITDTFQARFEHCQALLFEKENIIHTFVETKTKQAKDDYDSNLKFVTIDYENKIKLIQDHTSFLENMFDVYEKVCCVCCKQIDLSDQDFKVEQFLSINSNDQNFEVKQFAKPTKDKLFIVNLNEYFDKLEDLQKKYY